jgi:hypothetical protein
MTAFPSLESFLTAPAEEVAQVAPATVIYAPGGTRRRAALAGIAPHSDAYVHWSREQMLASVGLFFRLGVRHLFMNVLRPPQLAEVGRYRERVLDWLAWGIAGPEALAAYARLGWRVRLLGTACLPELDAAAEQLRVATPAQSAQTLWFFVMPTPEAPWQWLQAACADTRPTTTAEAIRALYGEDLPLATMYFGFGKPLIAPDLLPPLIAGELQCYWTQRPGYEQDERLLRQIVYDYAYLRSTWTQDKEARYTDIRSQRERWEQPLVLGLGQRLGPFWYPKSDHFGRGDP